MPMGILLSHVVQGMCGSGEIFDRAAIEVGKPKEFSQLMEILGCRPLGNSLDFDFVHAHCPFTDD